MNSQEKYCPNCAINCTSLFCPQCGTKTVDPPPVAPPAPVVEQAPVIKCQVCGEQDVTTKFCPKCGAEIVVPTAAKDGGGFLSKIKSGAKSSMDTLKSPELKDNLKKRASSVNKLLEKINEKF